MAGNYRCTWRNIFLVFVRGGIGIGLCGGLGLAILTLGFGLPMGSPPVDVILIIMTVVVAASALQAAGGMDYLVRLASNFMRRNPKIYQHNRTDYHLVNDHYGTVPGLLFSPHCR